MKIIAFAEDGWFGPRSDFALWDQLTRAFGVELQIVRRWDEAVVPEGSVVVLLDEAGETELAEYEHPRDAVYVFGNSGFDRFQVTGADEVVRIETPEPIPMFGVTAAALVLADCRRKE